MIRERASLLRYTYISSVVIDVVYSLGSSVWMLVDERK